MRLKTERLLVRDLTATDLDAVHAILDVDLRMDNRALPDRRRWLDWTILDYEQRQRAHQPPYGDYAVELTRTGEVVGLVGLVPSLMPFGLLPYYATRLLGEPHVYSCPEVGLFWATATAHQRRGYASEAAAALIAFGFDTLQLARLVATTEHDNAARQLLLRRDHRQHQADPAVPGYPATTGWDPVTGLGTPNAAALLPALAS